ncbi:unnamed protein product, partial [marine sediment metagenome]
NPLTLEKGFYIGKGVARICEVAVGNFCVLLIKRDSLRFNINTYGGASGSPIVNKWGNVIAVTFAGHNARSKDMFAVPLVKLREFLNSIKLGINER